MTQERRKNLNSTYYFSDFRLQRTVNAHDERCRRRQHFEQRCRQYWNVHVRVTEWIHQSDQCTTTVCQPGVAFRVKQNLVFGHHGAEQQQNVLDTQLLEQQGHTGAGDGQRGRKGWLECLFVAGSNGESHLRTAGRWDLDAAEYVADQGFQGIGKTFYVDRVDGAQAVLKERNPHFVLYSSSI
jgi:hypothetical protein